MMAFLRFLLAWRSRPIVRRRLARIAAGLQP
jgi:hypothetical protein